MATNVFDRITQLHEANEELVKRLEEARQTISEEEFEAVMDGPFGEILCAAMDVEYAWLKCYE